MIIQHWIGNMKIIQSGEVSGEIFDFIEDKTSEFPDRVIDKILSDACWTGISK